MNITESNNNLNNSSLANNKSAWKRTFRHKSAHQTHAQPTYISNNSYNRFDTNFNKKIKEMNK